MRQKLFLPQFSDKGLRRRLLIYLIAFVLAFLLIGSYLGLNKYFRIINFQIQIIGNSPSDTINGLDIVHNRSSLFLSEKEVETALYNANPSVADVTVHKIYPHTLALKIRYSTPLSYLEVNDGYFLLSEDGRIIDRIHTIQVERPIIHYYQKLNYFSSSTGASIMYRDVRLALYFLKIALALGLQITNIDINGINMIGLYSQDKKILFTTEKDQELQKYQLETIMHQFMKDGKDYKTIDLRFDKPVVELQ